MYDMVNIFEVFLPQLLRYPNPTDPLNGEAAALMMRDEKGYNAKVKGVSSSRQFQASDGELTKFQSTFRNTRPRRAWTTRATTPMTAMR